MTNPYRALCAELLNDLEHSLSQHCLQGEIDNDSLIIRARALLDQPEPPELTDEELDEMVPAYYRGAAFKCYREGLAAGLRWAQAAPQPESAEPEPPLPISAHDLAIQWNQQADADNQWDSLDMYEQLDWAQARAVIAADRARRS